MASAYKPTGRRYYWLRFVDQHGTRRANVTTRIKDKRVAKQLADKIETDAARIRAGDRPPHLEVPGSYLGLERTRVSWGDAVTGYLGELARHGSGPTTDHYRDSRTLLARIQRETRWPD